MDDSDLQFIQRQTQFAAQMKLTFDQYKRLVRVLRTDELITVLELVRRSRHNNPYRKKAHDRILAWLENDWSVGKPLDQRSLDMCKPTWPINYAIPTKPVALVD